MSAEKRIVTLSELQAHSEKEDLYILIHGKVYHATKFLDEHPGGDEVILAEAGKDATEAFEDVGHSDEAREVLAGLYIGELDGAQEKAAKSAASTTSTTVGASKGSNPATYLVPLALVGGFLGWRFFVAS